MSQENLDDLEMGDLDYEQKNNELEQPLVKMK